MESLQEKFHEVAAKVTHWMGDKMAFGNHQRIPDEQKINEFFDEYPLSSVLPYEAFDEKNNIFINKKSVGFILMTTPLTGATEETENILASLISDVIPSKADVQFLLWASDKIGHVFDAFEKARSSKGEIFEWLAKKRTDFLKKGTLESLSKQGSFILRDFRLFTIVSMPKKTVEKSIQELIEIRQDVESTLKSVQILTEQATVNDFLNLMSDLVNPHTQCYSDENTWNEHDPLNIQITDPEYRLKIFPNRLELGNETEEFDIRCFTVKKFPTHSTQWRMTDSIGQMFNSIHQIPCPFLISFSIRPVDSESASLKTQWQFVDKDSKAKSPMAKFNPSAIKESQERR
jgi:conjugal transfer ATP-binding protein TraC